MYGGRKDHCLLVSEVKRYQSVARTPSCVKRSRGWEAIRQNMQRISVYLFDGKPY